MDKIHICKDDNEQSSNVKSYTKKIYHPKIEQINLLNNER